MPSSITNPKILTNGYHLGSQAPLDDRLVFKTTAEAIDLGIGDAEAYRYYEGMRIWCLDVNKEYVWQESVSGLITDGFTYAAGTNARGIDYSSRTFNFVETGYVGVTSLGSVYNGTVSLVATVTSSIVVPDCQRIVDVTIYNNSTGEDITSGVQIERTNPDTVDLTINASLDVNYEIIYITA